jgi:hypothetical protein
MRKQDTTLVRRRAVAPEPLIGDAGYDYADAFEVDLPPWNRSSPEQSFKASIGGLPSAWRWLVPIVHRHVLLFRLGPAASRDHIMGWGVLLSEPGVIHLQAVGPLLRGVIVGRREAASLTFTTFVFYTRRLPARAVWAAVSPLHRAVVPNLLERAADAANQERSGSRSPT